jgi:hypothetical protein
MEMQDQTGCQMGFTYRLLGVPMFNRRYTSECGKRDTGGRGLVQHITAMADIFASDDE